MAGSRRVHARFCPSQPEYLRAHVLPSVSGHQIGNPPSILRQYYALGVRYVALTHTCCNAFADSEGTLKPLPPLHHGPWSRICIWYEFIHYLRGYSSSSNPSDLECSSISPTPWVTPRDIRSISHAHLSSGLTHPLALYTMLCVMYLMTLQTDLYVHKCIHHFTHA